MSSFALFFCVLCLMHSSVRSDDLCSALKPDGNYTGVQVYERYDTKKRITEYWMNNRNGSEWQIDISVEGLVRAEADTTVLAIDPTVVGYLSFSDKHEWHIICAVIVSQTTYDRKQLNCSKDISQLEFNRTNWILQSIYNNSIFLGPYYSRVEDNYYYLEVNRENRSQRSILAYDQNSNLEFYRKECSELIINSFSGCDPKRYFNKFSDKLFTQLESIVFTKFRADILFFTIEGRLKYCFNYYEKEFSRECSSADNMLTALEQCFQDRREMRDNRAGYAIIYWIILVVCGLVVIVGVIVVLLVIWYTTNRKNRKKTKKVLNNKSSSTTSYDSWPTMKESETATDLDIKDQASDVSSAESDNRQSDRKKGPLKKVSKSAKNTKHQTKTKRKAIQTKNKTN